MALFIALLLLCAHLACASVVVTASVQRRCWVGRTSIWTPVLRTGRRKCDRQCTVCTDAMGGCGWWACLVQEEHSHIDLPQHVATARGSRIQAASCGSVCVSAPWRRKLSVAMQIYRGFTPRGMVAKSVDVSKEEDNGEGGMGGRWLHPRAGDHGHTITLHGFSFPPSDTCS